MKDNKFKDLFGLQQWVKVTADEGSYIGKVIDFSINFRDALITLIIDAENGFRVEESVSIYKPSNKIVFIEDPTKYKQEMENLTKVKVYINSSYKEGFMLLNRPDGEECVAYTDDFKLYKVIRHAYRDMDGLPLYVAIRECANLWHI